MIVLKVLLHVSKSPEQGRTNTFDELKRVVNNYFKVVDEKPVKWILYFHWQLEVCLMCFKRSGLKAFNMFIQNFSIWERFWPGSQLPRPTSCQSGIMLRVQEGPIQGLAPHQAQQTPSRLPSKQWQNDQTTARAAKWSTFTTCQLTRTHWVSIS